MAGCLAVFSFGTFACAFVPNIPVFAHAALPDRRRRGGRDTDVARLHRRQVPLPGSPDRAGAIHERVDDRPDRRQHARRRLRAVLRLARHLHRLWHRLAGRVGRCWRARAGSSRSGATRRGRSGASILTVPLGGSVIFVGLLRIVPPTRGRLRLQAPARVPARLRAGDAVRRHDEAADGARWCSGRSCSKACSSSAACPIWRPR